MIIKMDNLYGGGKKANHSYGLINPWFSSHLEICQVSNKLANVGRESF